eukprot:5471442-Pyramimonas_sp.AAC.1
MPSGQRHRVRVGRAKRAGRFARACAGWRGRTDAPASADHTSQSPPHEVCKLSCGWVGGMPARAVGWTTNCEQKFDFTTHIAP